jgi:hypothetical protein
VVVFSVPVNDGRTGKEMEGCVSAACVIASASDHVVKLNHGVICAIVHNACHAHSRIIFANGRCPPSVCEGGASVFLSFSLSQDHIENRDNLKIGDRAETLSGRWPRLNSRFEHLFLAALLLRSSTHY